MRNSTREKERRRVLGKLNGNRGSRAEDKTVDTPQFARRINGLMKRRGRSFHSSPRIYPLYIYNDIYIYIYTRGERKMKRELSIVRSLPHRFPCLDALKPDIPRQMLRGSKW